MYKTYLVFVGIFCTLTSAPITSYGQSSADWRIWTKEDGLAATISIRFSINPTGRIFVNHGSFPEISIIDGYSVKKIPNRETYLRAYESPSGHIWSKYWMKGQERHYLEGLRRYDSSVCHWTHYPLKEIQSATCFVPILPIDAQRVLFLMPDCIYEFNALSKKAKVILTAKQTALLKFLHMTPSSDGGIWITGQNGLLKVEKSYYEYDSSLVWESHIFPSELRVSNLTTVYEASPQKVYGFVRNDSLKPPQIISFDGEKWSVYKNSNESERLFGWGGSDVIYWGGSNAIGWTDSQGNDKYIRPEDQKTIYRKSAIIKIPETGRLSGTAFDAAFGFDEDFWICNQFGITRCVSPAWQTPIGLDSLTEKTASITSDTNSQLWFSYPNGIGTYEDEFVEYYPVPEGYWFPQAQPNTVRNWINGCLLVQVSKGGHRGFLFFDPTERIYLTFEHPSGHDIHHVAAREDGSAWVLLWVETKEGAKSQLELYDGKSFQTILSPEKMGNANSRQMIEASNGDLWITRFESVNRYRQGEFRIYGPEDGYNLGGVGFCLAETSEGNIWVGGQDEIYEYDGETWTMLANGFDQIRSMTLGRDGSMWVCSYTGLHRYKDGTWVTITSEEGLPDTIVWCVYEDSQDRLWVGTQRGISLYMPHADKDSPKAFFVEENNVREIGPNGSTTFNFSGIDKWKQTETHRLLYSFRLDENPWSSFISDTIVPLTVHSSGKHCFEVQCMDRNWNISEKPAVWEFTVLSPWYKEPTFLFIIIISSILIITFAGYAINRHIHLQYANRNLNQFNVELQEANAQLQQLDQMKSSFVSQASHDLRTPLTAIKSSLDNIIRGVGGKPNEKHEKVITRALRSVERLTHLVNDVLDINRIESGRMVLEKSTVYFDAIVRNVVSENQPAADQKGIRLQATGLDQQYPLELDAGKMERVVGELVGNAIKYTPQGGSVNVALSSDDDHVILTVKDSGIGISQEECEKIWERFYRTDASKSFAKGSGLGLSIAKELVELHGGEIKAESKIGELTAFNLSLPIKI